MRDTDNMRLCYCRVILWYHDIQLIFWYSDTNTMSLRDYALLRLWGHGTITLWNHDSPIVWYHETMTTLMLWLLWCYQTMILWYYETIRLWGSATMGESMRVRKSKNRGVLKDSETVILGFYKTMDHGLWYFDALVRRGPDDTLSQNAILFALVLSMCCICLLSCFSIFPCFLSSFLRTGPEDHRTKRRHTWSLRKNPGNARTCKSVFQECLCPPETYLFSSIIPVRTVPEPMFPKHLALLLLFCIPLGGCHGVESSQTGLVVIRWIGESMSIIKTMQYHPISY